MPFDLCEAWDVPAAAVPEEALVYLYFLPDLFRCERIFVGPPKQQFLESCEEPHQLREDPVWPEKGHTKKEAHIFRLPLRDVNGNEDLSQLEEDVKAIVGE